MDSRVFYGKKEWSLPHKKGGGRKTVEKFNFKRGDLTLNKCQKARQLSGNQKETKMADDLGWERETKF